MTINLMHPVRGVQFIFAVIVLGLMAYGPSFPPIPFKMLISLQSQHGGHRTGAKLLPPKSPS